MGGGGLLFSFSAKNSLQKSVVFIQNHTNKEKFKILILGYYNL